MKQQSVKLIKVNRKSQILKPTVFGCLKDTPSINITKGCIHSCVYCYARGFTDAPPRGEVHLYQNLPEMLEKDLDKKRKLPRWVSFSTASDAFQNVDEILDITYKTMKLLLERGISISFLTKGFIPSDFIELFRKYIFVSQPESPYFEYYKSLSVCHSEFISEAPVLNMANNYNILKQIQDDNQKTVYKKTIQARIGIVSLSEDYRNLFEPHTASIFQRLLNIRNLINAGIDVAVRVDPIIPTITDSENSMEYLFKRLKSVGIRNIASSYLVMRPSIMNFFCKLPSNIYRNILRHYLGQPWQSVITSAKTRLLPQNIRLSQYRQIKKIAKNHGIECKICGCKNPDLPWEFCSPWIEKRETVKRQISLIE